MIDIGYRSFVAFSHKLNALRQEIYFACNEFRKPSKVLYGIQQKYAGQVNITYEIFRDKYWQSFNRFKG